MPVTLTSLSDLRTLPFDDIIDVRSPAEYAEDHIDGAISLPVLSNAERAEVGTIYVQDDRFRARKIGAALVAQNAARHLQGYLAEKPGSYRPLVYCWRGGQRSGSFVSILQQVGWRADTLAGGYRSYRRLVVEALYRSSFPAPVVLLDGDTGTAKTEILQRVADRGLQVLDLEGMAGHRGSMLGGFAEPQPSQKAFESRLSAGTTALDPARPVLVEAESSKIGTRLIPPALWSAMRAAPRLVVRAPRSARAEYLTRSYADLVADPSELRFRLQPLRQLHGAERFQGWLELAATGAYQALAESLMEVHYDPLYRRQAREDALDEIDLPGLSDADLDHAAGEIARRLESGPA